MGIGLLSPLNTRAREQAPTPQTRRELPSNGEQRDRHGRVVRRTDGRYIVYPDDPKPAQPRPMPSGRGSASLRSDLSSFGRNASSARLQVREEWTRAIYGASIGRAGIQAVDLEDDGDLEIVVAAGIFGFFEAKFWYVLAHDGSGYSPIWVSDEYPDYIGSLRVEQVDADPALEILVGVGGSIFVYDGATRRLESEIVSPAHSVSDIAIVDLDGDGALEAAFCDSLFGLYIYALGTGAQEYANTSYGCHDLAVGNVDGDAIPEIVLGRGDEVGYVLDGATRTIEWANASGFGDAVRLADVDADGRSEIVSASTWGGIFVFDADLQALARHLSVAVDLSALDVLDIDGDGSPEIVYGDCQGFTVHAHDGQSLALKWEATPPLGDAQGSGVSGFALGDVDGDGRREILWSLGFWTTGADTLYAFDTVTRQFDWHSPPVSGPDGALADGDVDADGVPELLSGSYGWSVHDAASKSLEYASGPMAWDYGTEYVRRIRTANVDSDPQQEVFVTLGSIGGEQLLCYDGLTHAEQWRVILGQPVLTWTIASALAVGDVDGDGEAEVVSVVRTQDLGEYRVYVYVLAAATGALEWRSPALVDYYAFLPFLRLANVDADLNTEIVVAVAGGRIFVIDGSTHGVSDLGDQGVASLDTADRDGDGIAEILIGTMSGAIRVISSTGAVVETVGTYAAPIDGLDALDVTNDGILDYVLAVHDEVSIRDGASGQTLWGSGRLRSDYSPEVGLDDSLYASDVDADGRTEIVVGLGRIGFRIYEIGDTRDLSLLALDGPDLALVGSDVSHTFSVINRSSAAATSVALSIALPTDVTLVSTNPGTPTCTQVADTVTCALGTLDPGSATSVTLVVAAQAAGPLTLAGTVSAAQADPEPDDNMAVATTTVTSSAEADLAVSIEDGKLRVAPGERLTYVVLVSNHGPWPVAALSLDLAIPVVLQDAVFLPYEGTYDPVAGIWSGLDLGVGQNARLTASATVSASASGLYTVRASVAPLAPPVDPLAANNWAADTNGTGIGLPELTHGTTRRMPLEGGEKRFWLRQDPRASYEVVLDEASADLHGFAPVALQRLEADLGGVAQDSVAVGLGMSRSLRWQNVASTAVDDEIVRVASAGCTNECGPDDSYRLRLYETTYSILRFNNTGGQVTVVIIHNPTAASVHGTIWFWSPGGGILGSRQFLIEARGLLCLGTSALPDIAGQAGSITVTHDAPFGSLAGKSVAIEPATGFSFDTPMVTRIR